jgi:uridine kinase
MIKNIIIFCCFSLSLFAESIVFVGIAGGTGSGKTTFAKKVHEAFPSAVLISQDSYYKDLSYLPFDQREKTNFDHPDSLEFDLLRKHLIDLKNGLSIEQPIYNFKTHSREEGTVSVKCSQVILVEGILLFAALELRDLFDIKIFVDTDDDIRILRRIERDITERSRDFNSIKEQYLKTVKPMHDAFVEPSKKFADVIIPQGGHNQVAVSLILAKLNELIHQ